jgi:hypothetical protein
MTEEISGIFRRFTKFHQKIIEYNEKIETYLGWKVQVKEWQVALDKKPRTYRGEFLLDLTVSTKSNE